MRTVRAEWTKLRSLPSTGWLLLAVVVATAALGFAVTGSLDADHCLNECHEDLTRMSLMGVRLGQAAVAILAALAVTSEYATRTIRPTLTATPGRLRVLLSKMTVVTGLSALAGMAGVAGSLLAARAVLPHKGFTPANGYADLSLSDHLTLRAYAGSILYLGLVAVLSAGLGFVIRDTGGTVAAVLMLFYGSPLIAMFVTDAKWQHRIHRFSPMDAGLAITSTRDFAVTTHIGPWAGLGLLSAYAAAAVLAGAILFRLRDA
ncbi:MAG: ABC transporter permease [Hamadaea sp.]|uniref:ABC transporter permease n=1 Tax=Hamadaea sp. TaxID=2024425 RepID=UPI0018094909|nr:ABC transporter permease [Hamadaea sp.]NUR71969.1 ABC transporter permease [Hamadaea sp.]NUT18591.1 ABC transporter permease [Hamadaea sp.]